MTTKTKSSRAMEIEDLIRYIRNADVENARKTLVSFLERGERVSHEIVTEYQQLDRGRA